MSLRSADRNQWRDRGNPLDTGHVLLSLPSHSACFKSNEHGLANGGRDHTVVITTVTTTHRDRNIPPGCREEHFFHVERSQEWKENSFFLNQRGSSQQEGARDSLLFPNSYRNSDLIKKHTFLKSLLFWQITFLIDWWLELISSASVHFCCQCFPNMYFNIQDRIQRGAAYRSFHLLCSN